MKLEKQTSVEHLQRKLGQAEGILEMLTVDYSVPIEKRNKIREFLKTL